MISILRTQSDSTRSVYTLHFHDKHESIDKTEREKRERREERGDYTEWREQIDTNAKETTTYQDP